MTGHCLTRRQTLTTNHSSGAIWSKSQLWHRSTSSHGIKDHPVMDVKTSEHLQ
ncbi:hypothetical protein JOB18_017501 [Solea senegalensis]|uniref:Uncharacterized protein n=1 Tax=Solea senegalensis TaxID=28829 RepID=A0AAV6QVM0_SOLSE|nr:hypothetical protein JOB18_017501 [Solea senegalensis]